MKKLLLILSAFCLLIGANWFNAQQALIIQRLNSSAPTCDDNSCTGFDVCQNFEGSGYDNSESPYDDDGTVDPDDTTDPPKGSQACSLVYATESAQLTWSVTSRNSYYAHFMVNFSDLPASGGSTFFRMIGSSTDRMELRIYESGEVIIFHGTSWNNTTDQMAADTWYHVWVYYALGTGADGVAWVEWAAETTYSPTGSGNKYIAISDGDSTGAVDEINFTETAADTFYIDQVLARSTAITEVCHD